MDILYPLEMQRSGPEVVLQILSHQEAMAQQLS